MAVDTELYKAKLEEMLAELTKELSDLGINNPDVPEDWIATPQGVDTSEADPNVAADRVEDWESRERSSHERPRT